MPELIVKKTTEINASPAKVWEILVKPEYIRQWDEVPETFTEQTLRMGSELIWEHGNAQKDYTKLTVTGFKPQKLLRHRWYSSPQPTSETADINYTFTLPERNGKTVLSISIGDWGVLANGQDFYDASVEFAESAAKQIKALAEA